MNLDDVKRKKICQAFLKMSIENGEHIRQQGDQHKIEAFAKCLSEGDFGIIYYLSSYSVDLINIWLAQVFQGQESDLRPLLKAWQCHLLAVDLIAVEARTTPNYSYEICPVLLAPALYLCFAGYVGSDPAASQQLAPMLLKHYQDCHYEEPYTETDMHSFMAWLLTGVAEQRWPDWQTFFSEETHFTRLIDAVHNPASFEAALYEVCDLRLARIKGYRYATDLKKKTARMYIYEVAGMAAWLVDFLAFKKLFEMTHSQTLSLQINHPVLELFSLYVPDMTERIDDPLWIKISEFSRSKAQIPLCEERSSGVTK